jgi:hypothetical protein
MKARIEAEIVVPPEEYFARVFANQAFQAEVARRVKLKSEQILLEEDRGDVYYREVLQIPNRDLPAVIKKVVGASQLSYTNKSVWHKREHRLHYHVVPSIKADRITIAGTMWLEPRAAGSLRVCELEVQVRVFGVGPLLEKLILDDVKQAQDDLARLINELL